MCTINRSRDRSYGCPVPVGNSVCGETRTLDIINEFKRLYEEKMHEIDNSSCGDCLQEKIKLQQDWIGDLTEQNEMLVRAVEELEQEATERVKMLEEKLQKSAQCICEVMKKYREHDITEDILEEPRKRIFNLESDVRNLLELIRRVRDEDDFSLGGLTFYEVTHKELLGDKVEGKLSKGCVQNDTKKTDQRNREQESTIQSLESKLGDFEKVSRELKTKQEECDNLQKNMIDMRQALTEEVATKHDMVLKLKRECQELEDRCIQADKQTAFRDDIIKELRKEIKQLKQQENNVLKEDSLRLMNKLVTLITQEEVEKLNKTIDELRNTLEQSKRLQEVEEKEKCSQICALTERIKELEGCLCDANERIKRTYSENCVLNNKIKELECCMCEANEQKKINKEEINILINRLKTLEQKPCPQMNLESQQTAILEEKIRDLELYIQDIKGKLKLCKLCRHSLRVGFCGNTEVQTDVSETNDEQIEKLIERDELIKFQAETLKMLQQELQNYQKREEEWLTDKERGEKSCNEVQCLENQIISLKDKLLRCEYKVDELDNTVKNKEDIIKTQKEALNCIEKEVDNMRNKEAELRNENQKHCLCIQQLKNKLNELETTTKDAERRASNLQIAVDLYTNTISVLEDTEEKYKLEIENQRTTISHLQEVLVTTKNELDSVKQKYNDSVNCQEKLLVMFLQIISESENEKEQLNQQLYLIEENYEKLQELNFNVELEHCSSLQDVESLENQLFKYHSLLKNSEDELKQCKCHLKKLLTQKKNFEEVIQYFKQEMIMMAEQLEHLQGLLTLSHGSAQEESNKLMSAYTNIQDLNEKLTKQLTIAEEKVLLESQMNQINEARINELEKLICEKEMDGKKHHRTVQNIKENLTCSLGQNKELQRTISCLTETLCEFQEAVQHYQCDNLHAKEVTGICQNQIEICKEKLTDLKVLLEKKTSELCKIQMAYNNQHRSLKCCQRELKDIKDRQKNKQHYLKCVIEELKDKLVNTEEERDKYLRDLKELQEQITVIKKRDATRCHAEIVRYRKIISDLRKTLTDLNKNLTKKEIPFESKCNREECKRYIEQFNDEKVSVGEEEEVTSCIDCRCEMDFYQRVIENLKRAVTDLKSRLFDTQRKNKQMESELMEKEFQVVEISKTQLEKDKEYSELKQKLMDRLRQAHLEESRFSERSKQFEKELTSLRRELELKTLQLTELERNSQQLNGTKCVQLACAQEEINALKEQLNRLLKQHCAINMENQKLHSHSTQMQSTVTNLEEKSELLKTQVEQYLVELQMVQREKDALHRKNQDLLRELRSLQSSYDDQQSGLPCGYQEQRHFSKNINTLRTTQETCPSPWSLGSQGTSSGHDESPCRSPGINENCDWYSPNFKNDSEEEMEDDEDWVRKVENLAAQVRRTNKMWKHKMEKADLTVSKDCQK
ncbi:girdin-like isoform X4 [Diorhabda sublineata]|uniref:girdin-like isoform X4 n=1 Tax=Diorhabda sublineata TaxID=1163346 RepID=UPI0024E0619A|nr:girdin-like isoform X4 [Diorhabda sublineata]